MDAGVIDRVKLVRLALQSAASVAALLLTTEAAVSRLADVNADASASDGSPEMY